MRLRGPMGSSTSEPCNIIVQELLFSSVWSAQHCLSSSMSALQHKRRPKVEAVLVLPGT